MWVQSYIRGVPGPPGSGSAADHTFTADFEARTLLVYAAAANASKHHIACFAVLKPYRNFDAADGSSQIVHDPIQQGLQIQRRGDELCRALQFY
jgi:hypothetical protein